MSNVKRRMPWWFWFAAIFGAFSFIPLLIAGGKTKNILWMGWGVVQLAWLAYGPGYGALFDLEVLFWIASAFFVFTVVRKNYLIEMEIRDENLELQPRAQDSHYESTFTPTNMTQSLPIKTWNCLSCGANNSNSTGNCEYCGVAMQMSRQAINNEFQQAVNTGLGDVNVILTHVGSRKIAVITEVRELTGLSLTEAKALVDAPPLKVKFQLMKLK